MKENIHIIRAICAAACAFVGAALPAAAGVIVDIQEAGNDVTVTATGSLDISSFISSVGASTNSAGINPASNFILGAPEQNMKIVFGGVVVSGPAAIGSNMPTTPTSSTGDPIGLVWGVWSSPRLAIAQYYTSGIPISSSALFAGQTLQSMGLSVGRYEWTWPTSTGETDFLRINVKSATPPPVLSIQASAGSIEVSWPSPSTGWELHESADLSASSWVTPSETVTDNGTKKYIIVTADERRFYRLTGP